MADALRLTRRGLMAAAGALAAGCGGDPKHGALGLMERFNEKIQRGLFSPDLLAPSPGRASPPGAFPAYFVSPSLPLAPEGWSFSVGGLVRRPLVLSLADLQRMPRTDVRVRHYCVEGWSAVATWHGVALADLAERAGVDPRALFVEFHSFDSGYWSCWDRPSALHRQTILAYGMNGAPLLPENGAPLRLYASVKLGYKMVKYLTAVLFLDRRTGGYWEDRGYEWFAGV